MIRGTRCLAIAALFSAAANAQETAINDRAPVPRQVLTARTAFIGNGGSQTYGADSYFELTKFDGGPNRAYESFYNAVKDWGHYDLVSSTDQADVLLVIRFTNPIVDRDNPGSTGHVSHDWIYDPQLDLSINDPRTGLPLWTITEHIEPTNDRPTANRHFDEAVNRLVEDLHRLILHPDESTARQSNALPPGAIAVAQRHQRERHAAIGFLLGGLAAEGLLMATPKDTCSDFNDLHGCFTHDVARTRNAVLAGIAGVIAGAMIGWWWPVNP